MNRNLKNMIILKSLPSNIIDEAIIILKENVKIKEEEKENKKINEKTNKKENKKENKNSNINSKEENEKYIIKEAELIVNNYVEKIETKDEKKTNKKEKNIKKIMYLTLTISIIEMIFLIIK